MSAVANFDFQQKNGYNIFSADFEYKNENTTLWYRTKAAINPHPNVFLACTLVPAMKIGEPMVFDGYISPLLLDSITPIMGILSKWYPSELKDIDFIGGDFPIESGVRENKKTACFFSGGVDSFYTLLKHQEEIDTIVYVHGFDLWLHETEFREMVSKRLQKIAAEMGKELIEVETNLLDFSHKICDWQTHYHGSALASVAMLLSGIIGKMYIPSSFHTNDLFPWASHPELDKLWSTEEVEIVHDGCEATRLDKVKDISAHQIALDHLRVCLDRRAGLYNCSTCEKCIRTMISLHIAGALEKSKTFVHQITKYMISNGNIRSKSALIFAKENQEELQEEELKIALALKILEYTQS